MGTNLELKHHKDFHRVQFQGLSMNQRNLVFALCCKVMNQDDNLLVFNINEMSSLSKLKKRKMSNKEMFDYLEDLYNTLKKTSIKIKKENGVKIFSLFIDYESFEDEGKFQIKVNSSFRYMLNDIKEPFTIQNLEEYTNLKSGYSQLLYSLLKEWEKKKEHIFTIDEFRNDLGIPETYDFDIINKRVLNQILKELPPYFPNLKLEKIKTGRKVTSLKFTWGNRIEKIENKNNSDVIDIVEISDKLNKSIEKVKKNRFIAPLLTIDNIEILVEMFQERDLIKGLNWSYREIKQEIKSLNYLIKSIKTGMEQKEKKLVVKTVPEIVQEQEIKEEILKENNIDLEKDQELKITEIEKIKITKDEYEELYKKFLQEQNTEHNLLTRKGFDIANKNKYEIIEKANNIMKMENEISKITITKEKYELLYQNFIILNDCIDNQNTRESFDLLNKEKYKIVEQTITIPITMEDLDKVSFNEIEGKNIVVCSDEEDFRNNHIIVKEGELTKKIISISDIPEEKLLGKNNKKLVGGALIARLEKIARDEETKIQYKDKIIGE
ncbi:replication initiation protein (plasmid) [Cetobacterium somerae]|uniref:replication initiation protein n=1 Tax=Cetobacterium somerae TaxID=188913 RepID=UPI001F068BCE|nr:replication initiation protein [Cetobacterium somerae]UPO99068.1 replication initiation protein [Cetobacterium somerae]